MEFNKNSFIIWFSFVLVDFPLSLRLQRPFSEELSRPEARNTEMLKQEVEDNVSHLLTVMLVLILFLVLFSPGIFQWSLKIASLSQKHDL